MTQIQLYINNAFTYKKDILYNEAEEEMNKLKKIYGLFKGSAKVKWEFFLVVRSRRLGVERQRFLKPKKVCFSGQNAIFAGKSQLT